MKREFIGMRFNEGTVFIIDDDDEVCSALRTLFESVSFRVKTYNNAHAFLDSRDYTEAGCLIVDVRLPLMSGLQLVEQLKILKSNLPVIMITGHGDVQMAVRAMKLGAVDFVLKPFNEQALLESVQNTQKGAQSSELDKNWIIDTVGKKLNQLSERERKIIDLISEGKLNKEIARTLFISTSTVEVHRANIMRKMEVKNLAQLLKLYIKYQIYTESYLTELV